MVPCFPLLGLTPSGLFMGLSSTLIYTSELILCSIICVPSATRHNIHMYPLQKYIDSSDCAAQNSQKSVIMKTSCLDYSTLPKANGLKNFCFKKRKPTEVNEQIMNCSLVRKPFIDYTRSLTTTASRHD